jgi:DNA-binding transcriptional MerR regulator
MKDEFTTFDIIKALKIPRERLREWMKLGFIKPTIAADGQGTKALFSRQDAYRVELFRRLIQIGLQRKLAAQFIESYNEPRGNHRWGESYLCIRLGARKTKPEYKYGTYFTKYIASDDQKIDLVKGFIDDEALAAEFDDRWDYIQIVNLKRLEAATDRMLEKL